MHRRLALSLTLFVLLLAPAAQGASVRVEGGVLFVTAGALELNAVTVAPAPPPAVFGSVSVTDTEAPITPGEGPMPPTH